MTSNDSTSALPSVDYDIVTGRPRRPGSSTGKVKVGVPPSSDVKTSSDATSAMPSVDYDIVTGQYRTQTGLSSTGNLSVQNEDSMGATMLGNEIKERFSSMRDAFLKMDANRDGRVSVNEIRNLCKQWNIPIGEANRVIAAADLDANGCLDFNEFAKRFDPDLAFAEYEELQPTMPSGGGGAYKARDERVCGGGGGYNWEDAAAASGDIAPTKPSQSKGGQTAPRPKLSKQSEPVLVYGVDGNTATTVVCAMLSDAGIDFERRDADTDRGFEAAMKASGFRGGEFGLPVVVVGKRAFWDFEPSELLAKLEACGVHADPPERAVRVYGKDGCSSCAAMKKALTAAHIPFEYHDAEKDESYEAALFASGFKGGRFSLPIVTFGMKAWWNRTPNEVVAELQKLLAAQKARMHEAGQQSSTPAGGGAKAASAIRSGGGGGGAGGGGGGGGGGADMSARVRELEAELAASKGREAKLEARVAELEEALKAATRVIGSSGGGGGGGGGGGATVSLGSTAAVVEEKPDNGLKVYGRSGCAKTQAVQKELQKAKIDFSLYDMDKDKSWVELVASNGGPSSGKVPPPVVVLGNKAWWEETSEGIAVHFPSFLINQLQKNGVGQVQSNLMQVLEKDVTIDEEIAERFHNMQEAFLKMDINRDGRVTKDEIRTMCKQWNIPQSEADRVLGEADFDASGTLDFREFARRFRFTT